MFYECYEFYGVINIIMEIVANILKTSDAYIRAIHSYTLFPSRAKERTNLLIMCSAP